MAEKLEESNSTLPSDWRVEYEQLSEDYRFFVSMGWQATVAVLAVDGLVLGSATTLKNPILFGLVTLMAGILTILMGLETRKWGMRNESRVRRLAYCDQRKGFTRFYPQEKGFLSLRLGVGLFILMMFVGLGMTICALYVMAFPGSFLSTP